MNWCFWPLRKMTWSLLFVPVLGVQAEPVTLRVAVLDNAPPMSYRDSQGRQTGFSHAIADAICEEMRVRCQFQVTTLNQVVDGLVNNRFDVAAVSLLNTPERRSKILFAEPYFRSFSLWFAQPGVLPDQAHVSVAVVDGSAQSRYAQRQPWRVVPVATNGQLGTALKSGEAQAALIPMSTAMGLMAHSDFQQLKLVPTVMKEPELGGDASFGINPRRPDLKNRVDEALARIKENGRYDRINSQFLSFRVN